MNWTGGTKTRFDQHVPLQRINKSIRPQKRLIITDANSSLDQNDRVVVGAGHSKLEVDFYTILLFISVIHFNSFHVMLSFV